MVNYLFKGLLALITIIVTQTSLAQVPQKMSYQAVIRDANNLPLVNTTVGMQISILQGSSSGTAVYMETQTPTTNAVGLVTMEIGAGTVVSGSFTSINWSTGLYWLKTETDPLGGIAYSIIGNSQLLSVPYAFFAGSSSGGGSGWGLTGNSGTVDGTNFIGTTDNIPFTIKVNNQLSGRIDPTLRNSFFGYEAGKSNTTGQDITAFGFSALTNNTTGLFNTAAGRGALLSNTTGSSNTAFGRTSLSGNTTGSGNTAVGRTALSGNNTGSNNTAVGNLALNTLISGSSNTGIGQDADVTGPGVASGSTVIGSGSHINGSFSTAIGSGATISGNSNNSIAIGSGSSVAGPNSTAIGSNSQTILNMSNSTAIGFQSKVWGPNSTAIGSLSRVDLNMSNSTAIGYGAISDVSNKIRLGNTDVTVIEGQVAYSFPSDARFKYNIQTNVPGLAFINKLKPVTYYFDVKKLDNYSKTGKLDNNTGNFINVGYDESSRILRTGFLAQDVEKICNEMGYEFDGVHKPANDKDHYSLAYSQFIMPLVKGMQEQQQMIEQQTQINQLQNEKIQLLQKQIEELKKLIEKMK